MAYRRGRGARLDLSASGAGPSADASAAPPISPSTPGAFYCSTSRMRTWRSSGSARSTSSSADAARDDGSQIIAASHSEVLLEEAADRDIVVAFVGRPHRIDDRGSQVLKALRDIGFDQYYQAEQVGWVLYLEGSTDLAILRAFASLLGHPARRRLVRPFVRYVENKPKRAREHFHGLREAKHDLVGFALFDRVRRAVAGCCRIWSSERGAAVRSRTTCAARRC